MPVQVINDPNRYPNRYAGLQYPEQQDADTPLVMSGINAALQGLIQGKTNEIKEKKQRAEEHRQLQLIAQERERVYKGRASGLETLLGLSKDEAHKVAPLLDDPNVLKHLMQNVQPQAQQIQQQQQQPELDVANLNPQQKQEILQSLEIPEVAKNFSPEDLNMLKKDLSSSAQMQNQPNQLQQQAIQSQQSQAQPQQSDQQLQQQQPEAQQLLNQVQQNALPEQNVSKKVKEAEKIIDKAVQKPLSERLAKPIKAENEKEIAAAQKETQEYYDSVLNTEKEAKKSDDRLNRMSKLIEKGNLPFSTFYNVFKNIEEHVSPAAGAAAGAALGAAFGGIGAAPGAVVGGALGGLISPVVSVLRSVQRYTSPDTEEFEKLSNQFISGAKSIFGARITDQDLKAYMAQIPTLSNTDEGKKAIINSMKIANEAEHVRADVMKKIIKENKGRRPANLPILVEEEAASKLDKLSKEFVERPTSRP